MGAARTPALRDYTTGVRPGFDLRRSGGPLAVAAAAQGPKTAEALGELLGELAGVMKAITADELARAKGEIALEFSEDVRGDRPPFEPAAGARDAGGLRPAGRLLLHYARVDRSGRRSRCPAGGAQYLDPEHLAIVIVGDRKTIEPAIRALTSDRQRW